MSRGPSSFFECGCPVIQAPVAGKSILSPLDCLGALVKSQLMINVRDYFWAFSSLPFIYMPISQSCVTLLWPLWTVACQASLSMGFFAQEYWSGLPFLLLGIFPIQGLNPGLLADSLPSEWSEKPIYANTTPFWLV